MRATLLAFVLTLAALPAWAQTSAPAATPAPLPPEAQDALKKGVIAAQQQDYLQAIRYFQDARKIAPDDPEIYKDLGLAESKIPGRELRAIAWFGAYLAAAPNAPNAAAVKDQIDVLDVKSQSNISRVIETAQDTATQAPGDIPQLNLVQVAGLWAEAGDMPGALKIVDRIENQYRNQAWAKIAEAQVKSGDIVGALKTVDLIQDASEKSPSQMAVTEAQSDIAEAQIKAGDLAGAQNTLAGALRSADLIQDAFYKGLAQEHVGEAQRALAEAQAVAGDIAGAQRTADMIPAADWKSSAEGPIAEAQAKAGDIVGAQRAADLMQNGIQKSYTQYDIVEAQLNAGDIAGAQKTADLIQDWGPKSMANHSIAGAQAKAGSANNPPSEARLTTVAQPPIQSVAALTVSDWLKKLDDDNRNDVCALNTDPFLDLAGYLKSLKPSFDGLYYAAKEIVEAQNVLDKMLKQQVKK
jgi:tetratricopeptide (TPR) repeat protein